jgi:hypothetical protein
MYNFAVAVGTQVLCFGCIDLCMFSKWWGGRASLSKALVHHLVYLFPDITLQVGTGWNYSCPTHQISDLSSLRCSWLLVLQRIVETTGNLDFQNHYLSSMICSSRMIHIPFVRPKWKLYRLAVHLRLFWDILGYRLNHVLSSPNSSLGGDA